MQAKGYSRIFVKKKLKKCLKNLLNNKGNQKQDEIPKIVSLLCILIKKNNPSNTRKTIKHKQKIK